MSSVREVFTPAFLLEVAGDGRFSRGAVYERDGRVTVTRDQDSRVEAIVHGTEPYAVVLWLDELGRPDWSCACPAAGDGSLCKHTVATALALSGHLAERATNSTRPGPSRSSPPREPLAAPDVRAWGKQVTKAFAAGGRFVDYRHAPDWAAGVHDMLDDLERLLEAGHAGAVLTLTEQAHKRAETVLNRLDDSDGWLTDISRRIADLHQRAAATARPAPRPFATRLFDLETGSHTLDTFHRAAATYAQVLGPDGLDKYRSLAQAAWDTADHTGPRWSEIFRIRQARIGIAIGARAPDELIQITRDDLAIPDDYLEIVQLLAEVGRTDEAIDWAQRGPARHADRWHQTPRLRATLADLLAAQDRPRQPRCPATVGVPVVRKVDGSGSLSFAGHQYRVGNAYKRMSATVTVVGGTVQIAVEGQLVRTHPIRHDRAKEHGAFANPAGKPDRINAAPPRTLADAV